MENLDDFMKLYKSLASFMNDFCLLKEKNNLSQKEIACRAGTTQSAISRIETLKTNPSYKVLTKLAEAVDGDLYITPMSDMTITVPFGMQDAIKQIADDREMSVKALLLELIRKEISENFSKEIEVGYFKSNNNDFDGYNLLKIEKDNEPVFVLSA